MRSTFVGATLVSELNSATSVATTVLLLSVPPSRDASVSTTPISDVSGTPTTTQKRGGENLVSFLQPAAPSASPVPGLDSEGQQLIVKYEEVYHITSPAEYKGVMDNATAFAQSG